jgi:hypothetical protein
MHSKRKQDIARFITVLFSTIAAAACSTSAGPTPGSNASGEPPGAASAPGTPAAPEPPGPQPMCTGDCYVLPRQAAALRVRPAADAPALAQEPDDPEQTGRRRIPLRYVGEKDGWVEVETLPARGGAYHGADRVYAGETGAPVDLGTHCYEGAVLAARGLGVHLYVRRDDLETVTTRPVRVEFPDRTAIALAPGVAVAPLAAAGVFRVKISHLAVELALPADGVGHGYVTSPLFRAEPRPLTAAPRERTSLTAEQLAQGVLAYQQGKIVQASAPPESAFSSREYPIASSQEIDPGRRLVTIAQPCIQITGIVDASHVTAKEQQGGFGFASLSGSPEFARSPGAEKPAGGKGEEVSHEPVLRAGAPLFWKDGQSAGRAIEDVRLDHDATAAGERRCQRFERDHRHHGMLGGLLGPPPDARPPGEPLELCFATADVSR